MKYKKLSVCNIFIWRKLKIKMKLAMKYSKLKMCLHLEFNPYAAGG